jgi:hypothetical protein
MTQDRQLEKFVDYKGFRGTVVKPGKFWILGVLLLDEGRPLC